MAGDRVGAVRGRLAGRIAHRTLVGEAIASTHIAHCAKRSEVVFPRLSAFRPRNKVIDVKIAFDIARGMVATQYTLEPIAM